MFGEEGDEGGADDGESEQIEDDGDVVMGVRELGIACEQQCAEGKNRTERKGEPAAHAHRIDVFVQNAPDEIGGNARYEQDRSFREREAAER